VTVDPQKLAARGLTISDVRRVLRDQNKDTSGGDIWESKRRYVVRTLGQFRSPEQVAEQILAIHDGTPVRIGDVATVREDFKKPDGFVRRFGVSCISINAQRETGANVLDVMRGLQEVHQRLNDGVLKDRGLTLSQVYDETEYIDSAVGLVSQNILVGGLLTVIVLLLFLRSGRSTLVIGLAIPTSIIGTFLMLVPDGPVAERDQPGRLGVRGRDAGRQRRGRPGEHFPALSTRRFDVHRRAAGHQGGLGRRGRLDHHHAGRLPSRAVHPRGSRAVVP
jgi:multidrug efflux pump subunit AcrB